jgi:CxxC-x17-CxxC domain-containing protein
MKDFKKFGDSRGGGRPSFGGKPRFNKFDGDRGDRPAMMHKATCAECSKICEVPFRPNGEKPVFCNDCFGAKRGNDGSSFERPQRFEAPRHSFSKPEPRTEQRPDHRIDGLVQQMNTLNAKLDALITLMTPAKAEKKVEAKPAKATPAAKKVAAKKPAVKKVAKAKK